MIKSDNNLGMSTEAYLLKCTIRDIDSDDLPVKVIVNYLENERTNELCNFLFEALAAMGED